MKKVILYMTALAFITGSCKKDPPEPTNSEWTVDGITYRGFGTTHPLGLAFDALETTTRNGISTGNFVSINFSNYMPTKSGVYLVKKQPTNISQCSVTVRISSADGKFIDYVSDDSNAVVSIVISAGGKLSASFSNIVLSYFSTGEIKTVSGNINE